MSNNRVTVFARMKAKDGMEEDVRQGLLSLARQTKSEEGCIDYELHQSVDDKALFMFYENWRSKEDLDKHFEMPYLTSFLQKADQILSQPADVTLWEKIS